jgi:hypothetical protein
LGIDTELRGSIVEILQHRQPSAALVSEVTSLLRPAPNPRDVDGALAALQTDGRVLVANHAAPDVHLESVDLRVVSLIPKPAGERAASEAAESVWESWLRAFIATHRCQ